MTGNYRHPQSVRPKTTRKPRVVWYIVSSNPRLSNVVAEWLSVWPPAWRHVGSSDQLRGLGHGVIILIEKRTWREHTHYSTGLPSAIERAVANGAHRIELDIDALKGVAR